MKNLTLKIVACVALVGMSFYLISLMKNEPNNFDPEKEWKFMLVDQDSTSSK
jgi:hypothetical protein